MFKLVKKVVIKNDYLLSAKVSKKTYDHISRVAKANRTQRTKVVRQMLDYCAKEK